MMRNRQSLQRSGTLRAWLILGACALLFALFGLSGSAQTGQQDGRSRRTGTAARPTPTPAQRTQPPILDEAPPPPPAKPTPVPTPDVEGAEIGEGETIKIDANLVNLQVRVIDRFNSPINN